MDPATAALLDYILSGKPIGIGAIIIVAIVISRAATKVEGHAQKLVSAVEKLADDLGKARDDDRAEHARTRDRIDAKATEIVAAVHADGGATREELAALESRRWIAIETALERAGDAATPAAGIAVVPRMQRNGVR